MEVTLSGILIAVKPVQPSKALLPIEVTPSGIIVFTHPFINVFEAVSMSALQSLRESYTLFPSSTMIEVKFVQFRKTPLPMLVTLSGIVIDAKPVQPSKALLPIEVTPSGIIVFTHPFINVFEAVSISALQPYRESYTLFPSSTTMEVKPLQSHKASLPMRVTLSGIVMEVKPMQAPKAAPPMLVTPSGIMMEVKPLQL